MRARRLPFLIAVGAVLLACGACGRRGALEAPGAGPVPERTTAAGPASPRVLPQSIGLGTGLGTGTAAPDPEAVRDGDELSAGATPAGSSEVPLTTTRGAKRGYRIPKAPFILDPLL